MGVRYKVHSYHETSVQVPAVDGQGRSITGILPAIIVELVPVADYGRTITHEAPMGSPEELAAARALFQQDAIVEMGDFKAVIEEQK